MAGMLAHEIDILEDWLKTQPGSELLLDAVENQNWAGLHEAEKRYNKAHRYPLRPECDECGRRFAVRDLIDSYGASFGVAPHLVCRKCYEDSPEPDTGRPDWDQLGPVIHPMRRVS